MWSSSVPRQGCWELCSTEGVAVWFGERGGREREGEEKERKGERGRYNVTKRRGFIKEKEKGRTASEPKHHLETDRQSGTQSLIIVVSLIHRLRGDTCEDIHQPRGQRARTPASLLRTGAVEAQGNNNGLRSFVHRERTSGAALRRSHTWTHRGFLWTSRRSPVYLLSRLRACLEPVSCRFLAGVHDAS